MVGGPLAGAGDLPGTEQDIFQQDQADTEIGPLAIRSQDIIPGHPVRGAEKRDLQAICGSKAAQP